TPDTNDITHLSLHDALPISNAPQAPSSTRSTHTPAPPSPAAPIENRNSKVVPSGASSLTNPTWRFLGVAHTTYGLFESPSGLVRSEEHTSELQSRENLVCRL